MSAPTSFHPTRATGRSPVSNDRSYPEVIRGDQYPEVNREHENLETVKDYPEVNNQNSSPLREKGPLDQHENRTGDYRIFGLRSWVLVALACVFAFAIAIAVGLAIGIPASRRNHENTDSATRIPSTNALTASVATSSQSFAEFASPTVSSTPTLSSSPGFIPKVTSQSSPNPSSSSVNCPINDTAIFSTHVNQNGDQIKSQFLKYKIHCNKDYTQTGTVKDMFSITVSSLTECINRCSSFNLQLPLVNQSFSWICSGVTLVQNMCYLKKGLTEDAISNLQHGIGDSAILIWDPSIS